MSFVRSVQMDSWTEKEIKAMQVGGNKQMNDFLASHGVSRKSSIKKKYFDCYVELMNKKNNSRGNLIQLFFSGSYSIG